MNYLRSKLIYLINLIDQILIIINKNLQKKKKKLYLLYIRNEHVNWIVCEQTQIR